jgi:hypothetical protein
MSRKKLIHTAPGIELLRKLATEGDRLFTTERAREFAPAAGLSEGYLRQALHYLARSGWLDTLFLALPVSWRGTLSHYAGRLHRLHDMKKEVVIYDYVDLEVPVLAKMYKRRRAGYKAIGYEIKA